jgi:hypothetical protein
MKTFAQFLAEKEEIFAVQKYTTGTSPGKMMASGVAKPANPAKIKSPYQGIHFPEIFGKPAKRGAPGTIHPGK